MNMKKHNMFESLYLVSKIWYILKLKNYTQL